MMFALTPKLVKSYGMTARRYFLVALACSWLLAQLAICVAAQPAENSTNGIASAARPAVLDVRALVSSFKANETLAVAQRYQADHGNLLRYYNVSISPASYARLKLFDEYWLAAAQKLEPAKLSQDAQAERTKLIESIQRDLRLLNDQAREQAEIAPLIPFSKTILDLDESRRRVDKEDPPASASVVDDRAKRI